MASLFGPSRYAKRLDPAFEGISDEDLREHRNLPSFVTDEEIEREIDQREANRAIKDNGHAE